MICHCVSLPPRVVLIIKFLNEFLLFKSNQIKSLLLSHHHSTSALVSEILTSVLQTVQKNNNLHMDSKYLQTVQKTTPYHRTICGNNHSWSH